MRPVSLTMSAFGPFSGTTELHFDDLKDNSLFLIAGPTGAGKTTILDAMVFALFGETSGRLRNGQTMRSDYADETMPTIVTFEFSIGNQLYKIERAPKQTLKKKRGTGTREVDATAILWIFKDGDWQEYSSRRTEVSSKIQEILGFRVDQFLQVVLLPQGEFRRLLVAPTSEREALMNSLFKTDIFKRLQEVLKEEYNDVVSSAQALIDEQQYMLQAEGVNTQLELAQLVDAKAVETKESELALEKVKASYSQLIAAYDAGLRRQTVITSLAVEKEHEAQLAAKAQSMEALGKTLEQLKAYESIRVYEKSWQVLAEKEEQLALKLAELVELKGRLDEMASSLQSEAKVLEGKRSQFEAHQTLLQQAETIEGLRKKLSTFKSELTQKQAEEALKRTAIDVKEKAVQEKVAHIEELTAQYKSLEQLVQHEGVFLETKNWCQAGSRLWKQLQKAVEADVCARKESKELELRLAKSITAEEEAKQAVLLERELVKQQEAALLAERLEEGKPCPVCGSLTHPHIADYPLHFDRNRLKQLEELQSKALENRSKLEEKHLALGRQLEERKQIYDTAQAELHAWILEYKEKSAALEDVVGALLDGQFAFSEEAINYDIVSQSALEELDIIEKRIGCELNKIKQAKVTMVDVSRMIKGAETLKQSYDVELQNNKESLEILLRDVAAHGASIQSIEGQLPNEDWDTWDQRIEAKSQWVRDYKEELLKQEQATKEVDRQLTTCLANQLSTEEQINTTRIDKETAKSQYEEAVEKAKLTAPELLKLADLVDRQGELQMQWDAYKEACVQVHTKVKELTKQLDAIEAPSRIITEEEKEAATKEYEVQLQQVAVNQKEYKRLEQVQASYLALVENNLQITKQSEFLYNLSDMANGGNTGLRGVTFELYVLGAILEEVVNAANMRLRHMSRSRYELQRTPVEGIGRGHRGLDLSVFDNYTGVARPANTLSGGETFLASLSLAMGLADVIQAYAGGVHLDTIFIDEGFGTLDPDALDVAMESLLELQASGRLVGVISHVPELKARIPAHLEVTPVDQGSVAKFVVP